jgi:argininosuccinate lyase
MKGLPSGYSKDLQEDKEALFDAEDTWLASLGAVRRVAEALTPLVERTGRAASGLLLATDVADYLVARGMPFRTSHEVVGAIVRRLLHEGRTFDEMSIDEWRTHSPLFGDDVRATISARASLEKKQTPQSTSPEAVAAALAETREWVTNLELE